MRVVYEEVPLSALIDWYYKNMTIMNPAERLSSLNPEVYFDPVRKMFIFKMYVEEK